jgi:hypothetical protein
MAPALGILGLHCFWVLRSDAAFEEAAVEHTLARARRERPEERRRRTLPSSGRRLPRILRLTATGWPAGAILWKNLVSVVRVRPIRGAVVAGIAAGIGSALLSFGLEASVAEIVGWLALMWTAVMLLVGPQWIRNDLRSDLPHFDLLRSYPLQGRSIIAAEAAGSAVIVTVVQLGLLTVAYLAFLGNEGLELDLGERTLVLMGAVAYLPAVNFLAMLIQNGGALLFPAWVRGDADRAGGVEALGQNMLLIIAHAGALVALMVIPAAAATALYLALRPMVGAWAEIGRATVFIALLALEAWMIVRWLGGVLDRTDPTGMALES